MFGETLSMARCLSYFNYCINNFANYVLAFIKCIRTVAFTTHYQWKSISWNLIDCRCLSGGEARGFTSKWRCIRRKLVRGCSSTLLFKISISRKTRRKDRPLQWDKQQLIIFPCCCLKYESHPRPSLAATTFSNSLGVACQSFVFIAFQHDWYLYRTCLVFV